MILTFGFRINSPFSERRNARRHVRPLLLLAALWTITVSSSPVSADTVKRLFNHGPLQVNEFGFVLNPGSVPMSYGVFQGSLFFFRNGKLLRLDSANGAPKEIPVPDFRGSPRASASFAEFDGSLFINLSRSDYLADFDPLNGIFRLDDVRGEPIKINMPITSSRPASSGAPGEIAAGIPTPGAFVEFDGNLYFFGRESYSWNGGGWTTNCGTNESIDSLFRIESAASDAVQVWNAHYFCQSFGVDGVPIIGSELGIAYSAWQFGSRSSQTAFEHLYLLDRPRPAVNSSVHKQKSPFFSIDRGYPLSINVDPLELVAFDGYVFFRDVRAVPNQFAYLWEVELARYNPASGKTFLHDMYQVSQEEIDQFSLSNSGTRIASSDPRYFSVANGVLYFQAARTTGHIRQNSELYRLTAGDALPELVALNPNSPSRAKPLGEHLGRLWLAADTGTGLDLQYFSGNPMDAKPLGVGESIASTAQGLVAYGNGLVFTAKDDDDNWGTYFVSIGSTPLPGKSRALKPVLTINEGVYSERPGFGKKAGSRVSVHCEIKNRSKRAINSVHVTLTDRPRMNGKRRVLSLKQCQRDTVQPGAIFSCKHVATLRRGKRRFTCSATALTHNGARLRTRETAFARGYRS